VTVPMTTVPFFSSMVTVSLLSFCRKLTRRILRGPAHAGRPRARPWRACLHSSAPCARGVRPAERLEERRAICGTA
jgi:hypothetical protein